MIAHKSHFDEFHAFLGYHKFGLRECESHKLYMYCLKHFLISTDGTFDGTAMATVAMWLITSWFIGTFFPLQFLMSNS